MHEFTGKVGLQTLQSSGYLRILKQVLKGRGPRETGISGSRNGTVKLSFLDQRMCIPTEVVCKKLNLSHYLKRVGTVGSIPDSHKKMVVACAFLCLCLVQKFRSFVWCQLDIESHFHIKQELVFIIIVLTLEINDYFSARSINIGAYIISFHFQHTF